MTTPRRNRARRMPPLITVKKTKRGIVFGRTAFGQKVYDYMKTQEAATVHLMYAPKDWQDVVSSAKSKHCCMPVAVLDMSPEAVEEMVELMRLAIGITSTCDIRTWRKGRKPYEAQARDALTAILGPLPTASRAKRG